MQRAINFCKKTQRGLFFPSGSYVRRRRGCGLIIRWGARGDEGAGGAPPPPPLGRTIPWGSYPLPTCASARDLVEVYTYRRPPCMADAREK